MKVKALKKEETDKVTQWERDQILESEREEEKWRWRMRVERTANSSISGSVRGLRKWKSQSWGGRQKSEIRPSLIEQRLKRRGKLSEREVRDTKGSTQNLIRFPQPREILVKGRKWGKIWEIPFKGLLWVESEVWMVSQKLEACRNLLRITATHKNWLSKGNLHSDLPTMQYFHW